MRLYQVVKWKELPDVVHLPSTKAEAKKQRKEMRSSAPADAGSSKGSKAASQLEESSAPIVASPTAAAAKHATAAEATCNDEANKKRPRAETADGDASEAAKANDNGMAKRAKTENEDSTKSVADGGGEAPAPAAERAEGA